MRSNIFFALLTTIILAHSHLFADDNFFWAGNQKVGIGVDRSSLVLIIKPEKYYKNIPSIFGNITELTNTTISVDKRITLLKFQKDQSKTVKEILMNTGLTLDDLEWYSFGFIANGETHLSPTNRLSFKLKKNITTNELKKLINRKAILDYTNFGTPQIKINGTKADIISLANEIYESGIVEYCYPDFIANIVGNDDPLYPYQYYLDNFKKTNIGGVVDADIDAPEAWNITKGSSTIKVAVIDKGVESHDDLKDINGNSRIIGGYTPHGGGDGSPSNSNDYHGEACAGIIAASHNEINVRGIAPNVKILTVNIFAPGTTNDEIADGINWAYLNGADVLSNSWGFTQTGFTWPSVTNAINNAKTNGRNGKGSIVVFAAGNTGSFIQFPANVTGVLCVSALSKYGVITDYSSRGNRIDISAIGGDQDIRTLDRMGSAGKNSGDDMSNFDGTSAACPQVSGVAALILSINPNLTEQEVKNIITSNATDIGAPGKDNLYGWGRLDAAKSVAQAFLLVNPQYQYNEGTASLTLQQSSFGMTFSTSPRPDLAAGNYICDSYLVQAIVEGFGQEPLGWFTTSEGYSIDNPNLAVRWVNKTITPNSITLQTYFYFIKSTALGQPINKWAPYDPTRQYATLGIPPQPLTVYITGPSTGPCATGTWTAHVSGGYPSYSYQWYHKWSSGGIEPLGESSKVLLPDSVIVGVPSNQWIAIGTNSPTLNYYLCGGDGYLRVDVTDSHNTTVSAQYFVAGAGGGGFSAPNYFAEDTKIIPEENSLNQNYPNPFNPTTQIKYALKEDGFVEIKVYDLLGKAVATLVNENKSVGFHTVNFDASRLSSGIYFYTIKTNNFFERKKMILLK